MRSRRLLLGVLAWCLGLGATLLTAGCSSPGNQVPGAANYLGDANRGQQLLRTYGCGSCHIIPGVNQAEGLVGPPLNEFGLRSYIAGYLPNNSINLERWIIDPQAILPGNAMPYLGVTPVDARDMTAYLLQLGR